MIFSLSTGLHSLHNDLTSEHLHFPPKRAHTHPQSPRPPSFGPRTRFLSLRICLLSFGPRTRFLSLWTCLLSFRPQTRFLSLRTCLLWTVMSMGSSICCLLRLASSTERNVVKVETFIFSCSFTRAPKPPVCVLPTLLLGSMVCPPAQEAQGLFRKQNISLVKLVTSIPRIQFLLREEVIQALWLTFLPPTSAILLFYSLPRGCPFWMPSPLHHPRLNVCVVFV